MSTTSENNKRIAKNTLYLYIRMFVTMAVALYTSRVVLRVLGASDYGLYNVVGGIVTMFSMFGTTLAGGTQRFLTFAMGEGDYVKLKKTFSIAMGLHVVIAISLLFIAETIGLWFLYTQMNIPAGRVTAAVWVYQFSVTAFVVNLIQVPFMSCLIAHERMNMYAYMSIYDVVMKLLIVFLIQWTAVDKLIFYSALILFVNVTSVLLYNFYCRHHFSECTFKLLWDKPLALSIINFSGWNIFGSSLGFFSGQGVNILLNIFCGTIVNAARGLATTVNQYIVGFVSNFQIAVDPQIVKMYAAKEYNKMYELIVNNARIAEYLYLLIAIPAYLEIEFVLDLWLGKYPSYTPIFLRIILIQSAFQTINRPLVACIHASGHMKWPNLTAGVSLMMIFPVTYLILKLGGSPILVFEASAVIWSFDNLWNIYWTHHYVGIPISLILRKIYSNVIVGAVAMFIIPYYVSTLMIDGWLRFVIVCGVSVLTSCIVIYIWGMTPGMKNLVKVKLHLI